MIAGYAALERQLAALQRDFRAIRQGEESVRAPVRTAAQLAGDLGIALDPWQRSALATDQDLLLLVTRQGGKGEVAALLALAGMLGDPGSTTVVISRADRQAKRLLRRIKKRYLQMEGAPPPWSIPSSRWSFATAPNSWRCRGRKRPCAVSRPSTC